MKFKRNGQRIHVRIQRNDECIKENSLWTNGIVREEDFANQAWLGSRCVGDRISDHPGRMYIEVLSPWFIPESTSSSD